MKILCYPDEALRRETAPVTEFDDRLRETARQMAAAMREADGVGLAAPQVGLSIRLCVLGRPDAAGQERALVNPEITERQGNIVAEEGCLSFPRIYVDVARATRVKVRYQDLDGREQTFEAEGLLARAVQHELDHLDGVLLVDKMTPVQRLANRRALRMLELRQTAGEKVTG